MVAKSRLPHGRQNNQDFISFPTHVKQTEVTWSAVAMVEIVNLIVPLITRIHVRSTRFWIADFMNRTKSISQKKERENLLNVLWSPRCIEHRRSQNKTSRAWSDFNYPSSERWLSHSHRDANSLSARARVFLSILMLCAASRPFCVVHLLRQSKKGDWRMKAERCSSLTDRTIHKNVFTLAAIFIAALYWWHFILTIELIHFYSLYFYYHRRQSDYSETTHTHTASAYSCHPFRYHHFFCHWLFFIVVSHSGVCHSARHTTCESK